MPDRTTQRELDKFDALLAMIEESGASNAGNLPGETYVSELRAVSDVNRARINDIVTAHRNDNQP